MNHRGVIILLLLSINNIAGAKDFGKQGMSMQVKEEGFITMIKRKLSSLDLKIIQDQMQQKARQRLQEPEKVVGIMKATSSRTYSYDPTYILDADVYLPSGKLLYAKGTTVNPLENMGLGSMLIFIDGSDKF